MDDPIYAYFSQNIDAISKEELLQALRAALQSANYWRKACLLGLSNVQEHGLKGDAGAGRLSGNRGQTT
jgi:hypothetical protein